jgi:tRNA(Ile2) C34 agmatinyltransferase TiaS
MNLDFPDGDFEKKVDELIIKQLKIALPLLNEAFDLIVTTCPKCKRKMEPVGLGESNGWKCSCGYVIPDILSSPEN